MVILDDATSEIYYAQLVEAESTRTVMAALREVIETKGVFCALYSDRAGHFFVTPKARREGGSSTRPTQVGRAMQELGSQDDSGLFAAGPRAQRSGTSGPGRGGCRRSCDCEVSPIWREPTSSSALSTLPSSTASSQSQQRRRVARLSDCGVGIWTGSSARSTTARSTTTMLWNSTTGYFNLKRFAGATLWLVRAL